MAPSPAVWMPISVVVVVIRPAWWIRIVRISLVRVYRSWTADSISWITNICSWGSYPISSIADPGAGCADAILLLC